MQISDLHCDLLSYIGDGYGKGDNPEVRCSWPQLKKGHVSLQVMALYTQTDEHSTLAFQKQVDVYQNLPTLYAENFAHLKNWHEVPNDGKIYTVAAIENASGLVLEKENLDLAFRRLNECLELIPILYISLTWKHENRFGGGNISEVGLKPDGKRLLDFLHNKKIAIDLSHTSDALAEDILSYIDLHKLDLVPIASHSNFRQVCPNQRNLPDEIAKEIVSRGGVIGLNLVHPFLGELGPENFGAHVEYAQKKGWGEHLCFGADFFYDKKTPRIGPYPFFSPPYDDASCYPYLLSKLSVSENFRKQLAHGNLALFFNRFYKESYAYSS